MSEQPWMTVLNEAAVTLRLGSSIDRETFDRVTLLADALDSSPPVGLREIVPAFVSLTIYFDPSVTSHQQMADDAMERLKQRGSRSTAEARVVEIPVCYGGDFGEDLSIVASHSRLTPQDVIEIHSAAEYLVHMIGFMPGFPYLGGMSERIATPRRETPRTKIPAGSVGVAGRQTGIYPLETPGGWQLIGRTPVRLFQADRCSPSLLNAGDTVRFVPISADDFSRMARETACPSA